MTGSADDDGGMTNPTTAPPTTTLDPRPEFWTALDTARSVVAGIRVDQLDDPTPCAQYDVRALTGHLVSVLERLAVIGRGGDPFGADVMTGVADADWVAEFDRCAADLRQVWADDSLLERVLRLPWTELPGAIALTIYVNEITVHTWDLATATGQRPEWDDAAIALAFDAIQRGLPAEDRQAQYDEVGATMDEDKQGFAPPFADVVEVPADAPLLDRLVAWNGRQPGR